jgi:homoserine kinase type II
VPSARPLPHASGEFLGELRGKPAALVSFLPGNDIHDPDARHCAAVGTMLARIHLAGASYTKRMDNPRGLPWWQAVLPEIERFLEPETAALLRAEVDYQARNQSNALPRGAIHADLFRDNVLFEGPRVSGVIDFYFACTDAFLYDVAITVNDWCVLPGGAIDEARAGALLAAYVARRPFTDAERAAWAATLRAAALRFWVSRLYDFHLPRPGELTHAKDPAHFQRILEQHRAQPRVMPA